VSKTMDELIAGIAKQMRRETLLAERQEAMMRRKDRRRLKLQVLGMDWITRKGWCCYKCHPNHSLKIGSWSKAWAHVKTDKHTEIVLMERLAK